MKRLLIALMALCLCSFTAGISYADEAVNAVQPQQECCQTQESAGIHGNIIDSVNAQSQDTKCDCCKEGCTCGDCDACKAKKCDCCKEGCTCGDCDACKVKKCDCCDKCTCGCKEGKKCTCASDKSEKCNCKAKKCKKGCKIKK